MDSAHFHQGNGIVQLDHLDMLASLGHGILLTSISHGTRRQLLINLPGIVQESQKERLSELVNDLYRNSDRSRLPDMLKSIV